MIRTATYRAVCWIDPWKQSPQPLTRPEQRNLETQTLLAQGRWAAAHAGLDTDGRLEVMPFTSDEPFEIPEVRALRWVRIDPSGSAEAGPPLGDEECREMTEELAEGRARVVQVLDGEDEFSHLLEITHNLDDTLLPFTVIFHARLESAESAR